MSPTGARTRRAPAAGNQSKLGFTFIDGAGGCGHARVTTSTFSPATGTPPGGRPLPAFRNSQSPHPHGGVCRRAASVPAHAPPPPLPSTHAAHAVAVNEGHGDYLHSRADRRRYSIRLPA